MNALIIDDHAIVRRGLMDLIKEEYPGADVSMASSGPEALQKLRSFKPDFILLDISMPGRNGLDTLKQIRSDGITAPILMLSMHPEDQYAIRVLKAGANGFLNKDSATEELILAIKKILNGKKYISEFVADRLVNINSGVNPDEPHESLSDREMQVFLCISKGMQVSEIADFLSLSVNTISTYRARILEKLQLKNNAELARYAIDRGLT